MMDVRTNHRELQMESKSTSASCIRLMDSGGVSTKPSKWMRRTILVEHLVVLGNRNEEHDRGHILETVDPGMSGSLLGKEYAPLLALGALSSNVKHPVLELANLKVGLCNSGRLDPRTQHVWAGQPGWGTCDTHPGRWGCSSGRQCAQSSRSN